MGGVVGLIKVVVVVVPDPNRHGQDVAPMLILGYTGSGSLSCLGDAPDALLPQEGSGSLFS
jgi:hypothetical protein